VYRPRRPRLVEYLAANTTPAESGSTSSARTLPVPTAGYIRGCQPTRGPVLGLGPTNIARFGAPPSTATARSWGGLVTIDRGRRTTSPSYTGLAVHRRGGPPLRGRPRLTRYVLHLRAIEDAAPLVMTIGAARRPPGPAHEPTSTTWGAPGPSTGQRGFRGRRAAEATWRRSGNLGRMRGPHNRRGTRRRWNTSAWWITPKPGVASVPVYGRAYPEGVRLPAGVPRPCAPAECRTLWAPAGQG